MSDPFDQEKQRRLLRAMSRALAASSPPIPADLKASLRRQARQRGSRKASWGGLVRDWAAFSPWRAGAALAFVAAGALLVLRVSLSSRRASSSAQAAARFPAAGYDSPEGVKAAEQLSADLWSADAGDEDESL